MFAVGELEQIHSHYSVERIHCHMVKVPGTMLACHQLGTLPGFAIGLQAGSRAAEIWRPYPASHG